jgi:hypothetical protein
MAPRGEQVLLGPVGVADADVQVHLLGIRRVMQARRKPVGSPLERQLAQARAGTNDDPAAGIFVDGTPSTWQVELGQSPRVGAVDHRLLEASDHAQSMPAWTRTPLPLIGITAARGLGPWNACLGLLLR